MMNLNPAAAAALLSAAARGPTDFYASLKASLLPSTKSAESQPSASSAAAANEASAEHSDDDEWDTPSSAPKVSSAVSSAESAAAVTDEAVVRNKHQPLFIRKQKAPKPDLGDETRAPTAAAAAAATNLGGAGDHLDFDDDFAGMTMGGDVTASAAAGADGDEEGEEVAVFDLTNADWWFG